MFDPSKSVYRIDSFISSLYGVFSTSFTSTLNGVDHIKDVISENVKQVFKENVSFLWFFFSVAAQKWKSQIYNLASALKF